jgi:peptidoglycan-associated lipoprotein
MRSITSVRAIRLAAALTAALAIAACSKTPDPNAAGGLGAGGAGAGAATPGSQQDFVVNVGDRVFFETDSTDLTSQAQATLDKQSRWLAQYPRYSITVEGHADERGTREYNIALSARRATAAREYLISQGVAANRISSIAYGKERPAALCDAEQCWSQNRRAVTVITGGAK